MKGYPRVYPTRVRGELYYVADFGTKDGRRHREYKRTEKEANNAISEAKKATALAGRWWGTLPSDSKLECITVFKQMHDSGVRPAEVWKAYEDGKLNGAVREHRTLSEAITETIQVKREAKRKERYLDELEKYLNKFARDREDMPVDQITVKDIEDWFAERSEGAETRSSNLGRLSSMFGVCLRRGYIAANPCKSVEAVSTDQKPPQILTVAQTKKLLRLCRKHAPALLPYIVLGAFLGIRPEALEQMEWSAIDWKRRRIMIDYTISKVRSWGLVDLPKPAVAWLKTCRKSKGRIAPKKTTLKRLRRKLREKMAWPAWPQDILRHTAASHLLAFHEGDETKVSAMLLTSPRVLHRRYRGGRITPEEAKKFLALTP